MRVLFTFLSLLFLFSISFSQTAITTVNINSGTAASSYSYISGANTYNWGLSPNNTNVSVDGFTAGGVGFSYASYLTGNVKLRRVNNVNVTGNFSLVWAEYLLSGVNTFNMFPAYQADMENFFNNRTYNKGTDNFFDNTSGNSNNVERLDWIISGGYSTPSPTKIGFAVFERGANNAHDAFCMAAITSLDGMGNPLTYSNIVRVATVNYGNLGANITYRILKSTVPNDLLDAGAGAQSRGGVIISLQQLGIAAGQSIYGYSIFANDLPLSATPADLVDVTNSTFFPTNTGNAGGIDMVAVTGIYIENSILPVKFTSFNANENNNIVQLHWSVENEFLVDKYEIERSIDGINFTIVKEIRNSGNTSGGSQSYNTTDNIASLISDQIYYRIKQYDQDNSYYYSKTISINRRNNAASSLTIYPNPVSENLYINFLNVGNDNATISIYNANGLKVQIQNEKIYSGNNSITIDRLHALAKGVYYLSLQLENGKTFNRKFVKQ